MKNSFKLAFVLISIGLMGCSSIPKTEIIESNYSNEKKTEGVVRYSTALSIYDGLDERKKIADKLISDYCEGNHEKIAVKKSDAIVRENFLFIFSWLDISPQEEVRFKCKK